MKTEVEERKGVKEEEETHVCFVADLLGIHSLSGCPSSSMKAVRDDAFRLDQPLPPATERRGR